MEINVLSGTCLLVLSLPQAQGMFFVPYNYTLQQASSILLVRSKTPGGENEDKHEINSTLLIILKCLYSVSLTTGNSSMNTVLTRLLLKRLWKYDSIIRLKAM